MSPRRRGATLEPSRIRGVAVLGRIATYLVAVPAHLALSAAALAFLALRAGDGDIDGVFWLCFSWLALQALGGTASLVLDGLALAFVVMKAGSGDTDWIFWTCFSWMSLQMLRAAGTRRALKRWRGVRSPRRRPPAGAGLAELRPYLELLRKAVAEATEREPARRGPETIVAELERLAELHRSGALSDEEFERAKGRLLE